MSTYKPKGSPYFHFDFVWKGRRFYGSTGLKTKRDADRYENLRRQKLLLGGNERPPMTIDEAAGLYQEHAQDKPSWKTIEYMLAALVEGLGGHKLLSEVSQRDLQVYFARRRSGRSNASVNREIENARAVWRKAQKARYDVGEMPDWQDLRLKVPKQPPRELRREEESDLFDSCREDLLPAVQFLFLSGWRRAEVVGLRWSDCDLQVGEAKTKIKGGDIVIRPLTGALIALIAHQPRVGPFVFTYVCHKNKSRYTDKRGRLHPARKAGERYPMTPTVLRQAREAWKDAGVEGFRIHDLRHTRLTRIVRATGSLAAAQEAGKHKSLTTTRRYAHVAPSDVRKALDASVEAVESRTIPEPESGQTRKASGKRGK